MSFNRIFITVTILVTISNPVFSQSIEFDNLIAEQRADPWLYKTDDGTYYLSATVPEYDRIVLRKAISINGLKDANEKVLWRKHETGVRGKCSVS